MTAETGRFIIERSEIVKGVRDWFQLPSYTLASPDSQRRAIVVDDPPSYLIHDITIVTDHVKTLTQVGRAQEALACFDTYFQRSDEIPRGDERRVYRAMLLRAKGSWLEFASDHVDPESSKQDHLRALAGYSYMLSDLQIGCVTRNGRAALAAFSEAGMRDVTELILKKVEGTHLAMSSQPSPQDPVLADIQRKVASFVSMGNLSYPCRRM